jgi:hypothetical protein
MRRYAEASVVIVTFAVAFFDSLVQKLEARRREAFVVPLPSWGWVLTERLIGLIRRSPDERNSWAYRRQGDDDRVVLP